MSDPIRRLRGRMIRQHYRTAMGCACQAWCDGYNECKTDETARADKAQGEATRYREVLEKIDKGESIDGVYDPPHWAWCALKPPESEE